MTLRRIVAASMLTAAAASHVALAQTQQQQPVFRSDLDVVTVDVSVRTGGRPVGALTAKDFVLLDNGVPQTIESVEVETVPVDISILIDTNEDLHAYTKSFADQTRRIMAMVRPGDRVRVTAIGGYVHDVMPARAGSAPPPAALLTPSGLSSAHDGLAAAMLRSADGNRRHLIIALTHAIDGTSTLEASAVREIARRSTATLHIVLVDAFPKIPDLLLETSRDRLGDYQCAKAELCSPRKRFWRPYDDRLDYQILREAAELTGGRFHFPGLFESASDIFRKVFEDHRRSYLLRYTPQGVKKGGWHDITVTVPAYPGYTIHARRGYAVETGAPSGADSSPVPARSTWSPFSGPGAMRDLTDAYERGDYARVEEGLRGSPSLAAAIDEFRKTGNPWPANPRREAAMVIELAEAALHSRASPSRKAAGDLLLDYRKLVRHPLGPDDFDRVWLWAVLSIVQGVNQQTLARDFVEYALARYPDEPRFVLARAFVMDQSRAFDASNSRTGAAQTTHVREVTARYDAAMRFAETAAEAGVRKAFFLHRIGRHADALAALDAVDAGAADRDAMVGYLHRLFRGRVLEALERFDEARGAYQSALDLRPGAQSPKVALMRLLVRAGERDAADALAAGIQAAPADSFDPWWIYWLGDYRAYPNVIDSLREQTR